MCGFGSARNAPVTVRSGAPMRKLLGCAVLGALLFTTLPLSVVAQREGREQESAENCTAEQLPHGSLRANSDGRISGAAKTAHRYKHGAVLSRVFDAVRHDTHLIPHDL